MSHQFNPELIPKVVERLRALSDETRMRILMRLREEPANVTTLSEEIGTAQPSISKHLAILKRNGLVAARREGNQAIYRIRDDQIFEMCRIVCDGVIRYLKEDHAALAMEKQPAERQA